jgi:hypothetical protein
VPDVFFIFSLKSEQKLFTFFRQTHLGMRVISREQPWKKNQWTKLICPVFRVTSGVMTVIILVTAGEFQMETTLESEASIFVMIKQRFPNNLSFWFFVD